MRAAAERWNAPLGTRDDSDADDAAVAARTLAGFYLLGALLAGGAVAVGSWPATNDIVFAAVFVSGTATAAALVAFANRVTRPLLEVLLAAGTGLVAVNQLAAGGPTPATVIGIFAIFAVVHAFLFLPLISVVVHTALVVAAQVVVVSRVGSAAAGDPDGIAAHVLVVTGTMVGIAVVVRQQNQAQRRAERRLHRRTHYDALTGLANRRVLTTRIEQTLDAGEPCALLKVDLVEFYEVNNTFGYEIGDEILRQVARRLQFAVRATDTLARLGSDDFAILLVEREGHDVTTTSITVAERVVDALAEPFAVAGVTLGIEVSVGIAPAGAAHDTDELLRQGDAALREARASGTTTAVLSVVPRRKTPDRLELLSEIRRSLAPSDRGRFGVLEPFFQPKVDVATGVVVGAEALVRWRHPTRGLMTPDLFMPLVERTSMMSELTRHVLARALEAACGWRTTGAPASVSVNVSARDLARPDFAEMVLGVIAETGTTPEALTVEVTETAVMADLEHASRVLGRLRDHDVHVSMDDFGTGWSSLTHLQRLPLTELKVDRSFVDRMVDDAEAASIVATTVTLGQSLGLRVVAEGVETAETHAWLVALQCDQAQGWLYGRPMPEEEFVRLLGSATDLRPVLGPPARRGAADVAG